MEANLILHRRKKCAFFLICLLILGGLFFFGVLKDKPVNFKDTNLEAAVRQLLDHQEKPIFKSELLNIVNLDLSKMRITSLDGIQYFRNLRTLNLSHNNISDLSVLAQLQNLREIDVSYNSISNFEEANLHLLADIPLERINLSHNKRSLQDRTSLAPSDVSLLALFESLERLSIAGNQVSDLEGLEKLVGLRELELQENFITNIDFLGGLKHLVKLNLSSNYIQSIDAIDGLITLETLDLQNNFLVDVSALKSLVRLKELELAGNPIEDLGVLKNFKKLQSLDLSGICMADISILQEMDQLRNLTLRNTCVRDLEAIKHLDELEYLNLRGNLLTDIAPLKQLTNLRILNLHSNDEISNITPIAELNKLEELILRNVPIGDQLNIINGLSKIYRLNVRNCGIQDLDPLAELMAQGALQDNPENGIIALVDVRDNPLRDISVAYNSVRPFWHNIQVRYPIELPGNTLAIPKFSAPAGFYYEPFSIAISTIEQDADIYYTLDGSIPTKESLLYSTKLVINNRKDDVNHISLIPTNFKDWEEPAGEVFKATIVRARVIDESGQFASPVVTQTYFVDDDIQSKYKLPIISLVTDADFLFDPITGIYNEENAEKRGEKWERPAHMEYFGLNGTPFYSKATDIRLNGEWTRQYPQKSLRLYAEVEYESGDQFTFDFFGNERWGRGANLLILRNSGQDWYKALMRDALIQNLGMQIGCTTQAQRPVVVFINGEYWGIHYLVESYNANYFERHYGVDPEDLVVLEYQGMLRIGDEEDAENYRKKIKNLHSMNPLDAKVINEISDWMDLDNFIDYQVLEIYSANWDWPTNNISYWRVDAPDSTEEEVQQQDGRWRWVVQDVDVGFLSADYESLNAAISEANYPLKWLLQNPDFREQFLNRFADLLNSTFSSTHVISEINNFEARLDPEMEEHIQRWRFPYGNVENWYPQVDQLRNFALERPGKMREMLVDYFDLPGIVQLKVEADQEKGFVQVNSLEIHEGKLGIETPGQWEGAYFKDIPVTLTAHPLEGYHFSHWDGEGFEGETEARITVRLDGDLSIRVVFTSGD